MNSIKFNEFMEKKNKLTENPTSKDAQYVRPINWDEMRKESDSNSLATGPKMFPIPSVNHLFAWMRSKKAKEHRKGKKPSHRTKSDSFHIE